MSIDLQEIHENTLYSTDESAKLLKVAPASLCNRRVSGHPPKYVKIGGRVWYQGKDLLEYIGVVS